MSRPTRLVALAAFFALTGCTDRTSPAPDRSRARESGHSSRGARVAGPTDRPRARRRSVPRAAQAGSRPLPGPRGQAACPALPLLIARPRHGRHRAHSPAKPCRRRARRAPGASARAVPAGPRPSRGVDGRRPHPGRHSRRRAPAAGCVFPAGERFVLSATSPPDIPVLALVPVETDFDAPRPGAHPGGPSGGEPAATRAVHDECPLGRDLRGWFKGAPEFEVHMLGQAGSTDSLTSYACARERPPGTTVRPE